MTSKPDERASFDMVLTRVFDAPVEQVWRAWSEAEALKQWWGPTGFTCPVAEVDFREGGRTLLCMRAPEAFGGQDMYNTWTYTEIVPKALIGLTVHFTDAAGNPLEPSELGLPPGIPFSVPHRITFEALDGGQTALTVAEYGYGSAETAAMSRAGMEQCLDKMGALW